MLILRGSLFGQHYNSFYITCLMYLKCYFCVLDGELLFGKDLELIYERYMLVFLIYVLETCEQVLFSILHYGNRELIA